MVCLAVAPLLASTSIRMSDPLNTSNPSMDMIATIGVTADSPNSVVAIGNTNRMWLVSVIANPRRAASITSVLKSIRAVRNPRLYMITSVNKYPPSKMKLNSSNCALASS